MTDRYASFAHSAPGKALVRRLGLPNPPRLRRHQPGHPLVPGPVLVGGAPGGRLMERLTKILTAAGVELRDPAVTASGRPDAGPPRNAGLIFDATGITDSGRLRALYDFFHPQARALYPSGRVIVLGTPPEACADLREATAQRALEGFVRSVGKEFGRGTTAQLVYVARSAEDGAESTLRFLLSGRSAYVSGQVIRILPATTRPPVDWERPLDSKVALVTGAARGIGADIARVLARDGGYVVCLDVPAAGRRAHRRRQRGRRYGAAARSHLSRGAGPDRRAPVDPPRRSGHRGAQRRHPAGQDAGPMTPQQWDQVLA